MAFTLYNHQRESSCCASWSSCDSCEGSKSSTSLSSTLFCGRERLAGSFLRAAAGFATDAAADEATYNKIQQAAFLAFAFAATVAVIAAAADVLAYERSSIPYSIMVIQRQCTKSTAGVTQRKNRLPLFQQVFNPKCPRLSRIYIAQCAHAEVGFIISS